MSKIFLFFLLSTELYANVCKPLNEEFSDIKSFSDEVSHVQLECCQSMDKVQTLKILQKIYSYQDPKLIQSKIDESTSKALFFRSFVMYFHYLIKDLPLNQKLAPLFKEKGMIFADPHPENFGAKHYKNNDDDKFVEYIGVNDFDDGINGPYIADFLRFNSSLKYFHSKPIPQKEILDAYLKGLTGHTSLSSISQKMIKKSTKTGRVISEKYYNPENPQVFASKKEPARSLSNDEKLAMEKLIKEQFPHLEINDSYIYTKTSGGSAGQARFELLVNNTKTNERTWLEIKPIVPKASTLFMNFEQANQNLINAKDTMNKTLKTFFSTNTNDYKQVTVADHPYIARARWKSDRSYDFLDQNEADQYTILTDQAMLLGKQHRTSMNNDVGNYVESLNSIKDSELLEKTIDKIQNCLDHTYEILKATN